LVTGNKSVNLIPNIAVYYSRGVKNSLRQRRKREITHLHSELWN